MLLKIIGSIIVMAASGFLGYILSRDCSRRPQELRVLQGLLQMFESEISFLSNLLADSFERIYRSSSDEVAAFFGNTAANLRLEKALNASQAWEKAIRENIGRTALNKEDEAILLSFGKMLGSTDLEGQLQNIRLAVNQLKMQEQKAEERRKKNEAMYRSLGILGGIAVVIVLF